MTTALAAGLLLGMAGSGHCVAMCGPLVVSLARGSLRRPLLYHAGRIATYALFGTIVGQAGYALALAGLGRPLALVAGLFLLGIAAGRVAGGRTRVARAWTNLAAETCARANRWSQAHPVTGPLVSGAANGLLPCGLVYAAVAAASAFADRTAALVFMAAFGAGTIPALMTLSWSAGRAPKALHAFVHRAMPVVLTAIAALLIVRGASPLAAIVSACHRHLP